ncbi:unnamed protein product [Allacma fusca]|uniref:Prolyl endopeptidase n=1 Tax=Allacma fusca TaxID=39272 RepID=A0A8J2K1V5_9HEXA|nr:unnamed protein product [Allacma fusca]
MKGVLIHFLVAANLLKFPYPKVYRDETFVDYFHGVEVPDPYHWLEDLESDETNDFVEAQLNLTYRFLSSIPNRQGIEKAYTKYINYNVYGLPVQKANKYFFTENTGEHHEILFVQESLDAEPKVLFDPNLLPEYWTFSLGEMTLSNDGSILAYHLSKFGSDWQTIHFRNLSTKMDLPEVLEHSKGPDVSWTHDNQGVFYSRFPVEDGEVTSTNNKLYYHKIGTNQSEDVLILEFPMNPKWSMAAEVTDDGKYLVIIVADNAQDNALYIAKLDGSRILPGFNNSVVPVIESVHEASYDYITNFNSVFLFVTNKDTNNARVISIDVDKVIESYMAGGPYGKIEQTVVIPEDPTKVLEWAYPIKNDTLLLGYIQDVKNTLEMVSIGNVSKRTTFTLPEHGHIGDVAGSYPESDEFFFKFQSFLNPGTIYRCKIQNQEFDCQVYKQAKAERADPQKFVVQQKFFKSKDGTSVPMYIIHRKGAVFNGTTPTILTGYGGFSEPVLPEYDIMKLFFVEYFHGVFAIANIRGGGEYGKHWVEEGSRFKKQNTFDDFIAAAEYLIRANYTNSKNLVIKGSSNGGLLIAACVNQRPDLFGAGIVHVGVLDMLQLQYKIGSHAKQTNPLLLRVSDEHGHDESTVEFDTDIFAFCAESLGWRPFKSQPVIERRNLASSLVFNSLTLWLITCATILPTVFFEL